MQPQVRVFCMTVFVFFLILFGSRITEQLGLDFRVSLEREGIRSRKNEIVFCCDLGFFVSGSVATTVLYSAQQPLHWIMT